MRLDDLTPADFEIGRKAVEDALIEWRDDRLSMLGRRNGLVVAERDGTPSSIIRFGFETGMKIAVDAILAAAAAGTTEHPKEPNDD